MASIFKLNEQLIAFQNMIAESGEDLDEQALRDTLEGLEGSIENKLKDYAAVVKNLEGDVAGMKAAEKDISTRRKSTENAIERMKSVMAQTMQLSEIDKIEDPRFVLGFRKCAPSAEIVDEEALPDMVFVPQDPRVDKKLLLELLKDGQEIDGARLVTDKKNFYVK